MIKLYIIEDKTTGYVHLVQAYAREHLQGELDNLGLTNVYIRGARHGNNY